MAKAKKPEGEGASAPKKKTASRSKKTQVKAETKPAGPVSQPLVDTNLAALNAARMLATKAKLGEAAEAAEPAQKESGTFKQLKESLNKPAAHAVNAAMGNAFGPAKSNLPTHGFSKQTAHNQTQGGFNRVNVPRRTAG